MHEQSGHHDERGLSQSAQWAVLTPVVMLALLGVIDAGIWLHARSTVQQAAMTAAEVGALAGQGRSQVEQCVRSMTGELTDVTTTVEDAPGRITVRVEARAPLALDLGLARVGASSTRATEDS
ncbi:TadE/TadG family type IV pilus assembly protein [Propionibacterium australiense]|uniref:TadE-like n=1 Tax=Propionibacterium australiense TaxID=119981 RepID=A0A383S897_9ACTN|nr:TadE family protein [Propionibacterium australiense]RLP08506.1 pilus assembly protein [Propionibacterium australiense]SYZ33644.1 TadE-like [Propionibacterium australiense]VEH88859.1 TadE-like protein [Propionibacterium australiense]